MFGAIRTLIGAEFAAFLSILAALFTAADIHTALGLGIVAMAIPLLASRLGFHWFHQGLRQNAFLVALIEVPLYAAGRLDHAPWILANRAEPLLPRERSLRRHRIGGDLLEFLSQQWVLVAGAFVAMLLASARLWGGGPDALSYLLAAAEVLVGLCTLIQVWGFYQEAKTLALELTRRWIAFRDDERRLIKEYLATLDVENLPT